LCADTLQAWFRAEGLWCLGGVVSVVTPHRFGGLGLGSFGGLGFGVFGGLGAFGVGGRGRCFEGGCCLISGGVLLGGPAVG
jgi:hypothetical protein